MKKIFELLSEIRPADQKAMEAARLRWNSVAKPIGSLGILEEDIIKIAGILGCLLYTSGCMDGTCGAVAGACILAGMKRSTGNLEKPDSKAESYKPPRMALESL